jgi:5-(carboxyamino)imidazole ribonucleotide synthase
MLPSNKTIGVIGGGQLGKMLIESSRPWNVKNIVLEADADCPASRVADEVVVGGLYDAESIDALASKCDVVTFEIEHINADHLLLLEAQGKRIIPSPRVLKLIQDKGLQKEFYQQHQLDTLPYVLLENQEDLMQHIQEFKSEYVVIKSRTGGYDGKGVEIVDKHDILAGKYTLKAPSVMEVFLHNAMEIAVIVSRSERGEIQTFPLIEMYFNPHSNLVEFLFSPATVSETTAQLCTELATRAVVNLNAVGVFAVELFVDTAGRVFINEIAPRPHNSGHHTIEGCYTSQFEQLNRILLGLPLGSTALVQPSAMINLVGPAGLSGAYRMEHAETLLQMEGVYIHLYNKKEIRPNRKMGHVTVMAETHDALIEKAAKVRALCQFVAG